MAKGKSGLSCVASIAPSVRACPAGTKPRHVVILISHATRPWRPWLLGSPEKVLQSLACHSIAVMNFMTLPKCPECPAPGATSSDRCSCCGVLGAPQNIVILIEKTVRTYLRCRRSRKAPTAEAAEPDLPLSLTGTPGRGISRLADTCNALLLS